MVQCSVIGTTEPPGAVAGWSTVLMVRLQLMITMMITVPATFHIQFQFFLLIGKVIFFMLVDLLEGILIAVGRTAGAEGENDIADTAGHGEEEWSQDALAAVRRGKDEMNGYCGSSK